MVVHAISANTTVNTGPKVTVTKSIDRIEISLFLTAAKAEQGVIHVYSQNSVS